MEINEPENSPLFSWRFANAQFNEATGELLIFGYSASEPYMHYGVVDPHGNRVDVEDRQALASLLQLFSGEPAGALIEVEEAGYAAAQALIASKVAFDAIFAASDLIAVGAMRAVVEIEKRLGLRLGVRRLIFETLAQLAAKAGSMDLGKAEKDIARKQGIIHSMTPRERSKPELIKATRKRRIAMGAGVQVQDVNRLLKEFEQMQDMMKKMSGGGMMKMMKRLGAMKGMGGFGGMGGGGFPGMKR